MFVGPGRTRSPPATPPLRGVPSRPGGTPQTEGAPPLAARVDRGRCDLGAVRALLLLLALAAGPARANMASPTEPGTPAGEPAASLEGLRVARETLTLDLRPLAADRLAAVEAEYRIVNAGEQRVVPLQFIALGRGVRAAQVWLDGQPVVAVPTDSARVPAAWTAVTETPALDGSPLPYALADRRGARGLLFVLTVPPGRHTVRVSYRVRPGSTDAGDHPNRVWQLAYSLAPARRWAGFGQLDLAVLVPDGWDVAASLPMRPAQGGGLVGRFAGVPGDVLAVSARAPEPALRVPFRVAGGLVALLVVGFVGVVTGRLVARARRPVRAAWPGALLGGVVAAVALVALVSTGDDLGDSAAYGYRTVVAMVTVVGPLAVALGVALTFLVAAWAARRWRPGPLAAGYSTGKSK